MGKKRFIDPENSVTFQLVHRSQRDPRIVDATASKLVLRPLAPSANLARKGKGLDSTESFVQQTQSSQFDIDGDFVDADSSSEEESENDSEPHSKPLDRPKKPKAYSAPVVQNDAATYGIFYNDQESYDYMQHLKPMGEDPTAQFIAVKSSQPKEPTGGIQFIDEDASSSMGPQSCTRKKVVLPEGVLPSDNEEAVGLLNRMAQPYAGGLNLELGEDVREVLYALDDDEYVEDELEDDFFGALDAKEIPEKFQEMVNNAENSLNGDIDSDDDKDIEPGQEWMKEYMRFQRKSGKPPPTGEEFSDDSCSTDATPKGPIRAGDNRARSRKGPNTDISSYSMSSSSLFRNDKLTLLDDQFDKVLAEYSDDEIGELDPDDPEVKGVVDAMASLGGPSRTSIGTVLDGESEASRHLGAMFDDFLDSTQVVANGKALIPARQHLDVLRGQLREDASEIVHKYAFEEEISLATQEELDRKVYMPEEKKYDTWDVESVLSTYSNIYNRPKLIAEISKTAPRIILKGPHGMPSLVSSNLGQTQDDSGSDGDSDGDTASCFSQDRVDTSVGRNKQETATEKRLRKAQVKMERRDRRASKKMTKSAFHDEKQRQVRLTSNHERQERSFGLV
ncbi:hypothetical protein BASA50_000449 [Batrachochytrium salamandrivorans]|uniref:Low temperature viability protein n=1 Tax=Batrachochytrium salamandrivorans TaxID=1357716 RepID=A0ABQ8ETT5_9FUNG|nr:hypothetical protein BASA60_008405 [Batrachochytrium salamandrivorans]KAH6586494.1 hypothetical protein BASA50_000449 [Batrachochytrium salamandrivorans]KAH9246871.1 hypothetical protein BASA81_015552 [Batrachochytrium salamandrivorans]KAH9275438.1 hypothetical protein BASA83_002212 [Batrachochytrium salamandrivorans]